MASKGFHTGDYAEKNHNYLPAPVLAGDGAFEAAIERDMQRIYHVALRITRNREDAEDAAQQSMLNAFTHRTQFRGQSSFSTWLTRIAINEALGRVRKEKVERSRRVSETATPDSTAGVLETLSAGEDSSPDHVVAKRTRQRVLNEAIDNLRGESRAVVWLLGIHERPIKEAAQVLNISESAVKARFYRARRQLKASLAERV
jgi:RNA polymerase sigma-70 factor (ECF subfamily)